MNYVYGYRTKRSMMNEETWRFANQYFGKYGIFREDK
nr:SdpI family protein [Oribacterium parvum]